MTEVAIFGAGRIGKIHAGNLAAQPGEAPPRDPPAQGGVNGAVGLC